MSTDLHPDQTTKGDTTDKQQINNSSSQEMSATVWQEMGGGKSSDYQPQSFSLTDNNSTTANGDAPLSIRTGVTRGTESLPAVEFFDSAATNASPAALPGDSATQSEVKPTDSQASKPSEMKWESFSASYVGESAAFFPGSK
ncbi:hypothetical protein BH11CYA1_BH11CYA1_18240 [soil metagenome]